MVVEFILLAHPRSGSTLVAHSLIEHSQIIMYGELFHADEKERQLSFRAGNSNLRLRNIPSAAKFYHDGEDGERFLQEAVFYERYWKQLRAVGFKMFYEHARADPPAKRVWTYLLAHRDIRVVHLVRRNLLQAYLSLRVARLTNEWVYLNDNSNGVILSQVEPLYLAPDECFGYFNEIIACREWVRVSFAHHKVFELEYERDLCGDFERTIHRIERFLDVTPEPAKQMLIKQAQCPPQEQIVNYAELKEYFRYTLYESFFE